VDYVKQRYGCAFIAFDRYLFGPSIKDVTHGRRSRYIGCPKISIQLQMPCLVKKKDDFLSNAGNKRAITSMLSGYLNDARCKAYQLPADADLLIVMTAADLAEHQLMV